VHQLKYLQCLWLIRDLNMKEIKTINNTKIQHNFTAILIKSTYLKLLKSKTPDASFVTLLCRFYSFDICIKLLCQIPFRNSINSVDCVIHVLTLPHYKNKIFLPAIFFHQLIICYHSIFMKHKLFLFSFLDLFFTTSDITRNSSNRKCRRSTCLR
jgi:hypothetical protein